jgi:opacity protein-like surface antigen
MKNLLIASSAAAALLLGAGAAQADILNTPYVSVLGGWSSHPALALGAGHSGVDDGYNVGARVGTWLEGLPGFTLDADYFHNEGDFIGSHVGHSSDSYMADLSYHLPTGTPWSVYGGAGLGAVTTSVSGSQYGDSTVLGWQLLGGAEYRLNDMTSMFAEYRYQNAHGANLDSIAHVGNTSNSLSVGVKFSL